jgi:hypothetical protein
MGFVSASRTFPGFSGAYVLEEGDDGNAFRGRISLDDPRAVTRAERAPTEHAEVRWAMGRGQPSDIIYTTSVEPVLISDRVVDILKANELSGWRTYSIELFGQDGVRIPGYQGLAVHGRCGPIDDSRAVQFQAIYPGGIFPVWRGLFFDPETWDGSDLFMPSDNWGHIMVVDTVRHAFEKAKVTNVMFTALEAVERPDLEIKLKR